jgi:hypothetical protein
VVTFIRAFSVADNNAALSRGAAELSETN